MKVKIVGYGQKCDMKAITGTVTSVKAGTIYVTSGKEKMKFDLWTGKRTGDGRNTYTILTKNSHRRVTLGGWGR